MDFQDCEFLRLNFNFSFTDNETAVFMKIIQFANYIVSKNSPDDLTILTGGNLNDRKNGQHQSINLAGILQTIPVNFEQIEHFNKKYKKK